MDENSIHGEPVDGLHHSRFFTNETEFDILLTGVPDEIIRDGDSLAVLDYKTSRHTDGQDALLPIYSVQLNVYARIAEKLNMGKVNRLALIYYEPQTDIGPEDILNELSDEGFSMRFRPQIVPVTLRPEVIPPLLRQAREIFDSPTAPDGRAGCENCELVERMCGLIQTESFNQAGP